MTLSEADRGAMVEMAPVIVVGVPRSGTTLVYHLLLSSGRFPVYEAESRILMCEEYYGSLRSARNRRRFLEEFLRSRQYYRSQLSEEIVSAIVEDCRSYEAMLARFMATVAASQGMVRWVEKTPGHLAYLSRLRAKLPTARFIHVVRDGRDVALSARRLGWTGGRRKGSLGAFMWALHRWEAWVQSGNRFVLENPEISREVRYEDIVREPDKWLEQLARFVDIDLSPEIVARSPVGSVQIANTAFDGEMRGLSSRGVERWREMLNERERRLAIASTGDLLRRLGYETQTGGDDCCKGLRLRDRALVYWSRLEVAAELRVRRLVSPFLASPLEIGAK